MTFLPSVDYMADHSVLLDLVEPNTACMDFGYNRGAFSHALAALRDVEIHAFEPSPSLVKQASPNSYVRLHNFAISGQCGRAYLATLGQDCPRIVRDPSEADGLGEVATLSLEAALAHAGDKKISLVKVDIEGSEFDVFESANLATISRVSQYTVEFHDRFFESGRHRLRETLAKMKEAGFFYVSFSRKPTDVLFVNKRRLRNPLVTKLWLAGPVRHAMGARRIARRTMPRLKRVPKLSR